MVYRGTGLHKNIRNWVLHRELSMHWHYSQSPVDVEVFACVASSKVVGHELCTGSVVAHLVASIPAIVPAKGEGKLLKWSSFRSLTLNKAHLSVAH